MSNNETIQAMLEKFLPFAQERMGFKTVPEIRLESDEDNAQKPLGKTAYYDPSSSSVTVFVTGRHPKDIMRSISHELVHHTQNGRGEFDKVTTVGEGYAQNDEHLREMEREAYEQGNLCFRDWEDSIKTHNEELNMFEKRNKKLSEGIMKKFGYKTPRITEGKIKVHWDFEDTDLEGMDPSQAAKEAGIPEVVEVPEHLKTEDEIGDWLSDEYGFTHHGWESAPDAPIQQRDAEEEGKTILSAAESVTLFDLISKYKSGDEFDALGELEKNQELMDHLHKIFGHDCPHEDDVAKCLMDQLISSMEPKQTMEEELKKTVGDTPNGCVELEKTVVTGDPKGKVVDCPEEEEDELEEATGFDKDFGDEFDHLFAEEEELMPTPPVVKSAEVDCAELRKEADWAVEVHGIYSKKASEAYEKWKAGGCADMEEGCTYEEDEEEEKVSVKVKEGLFDNRHSLLYEKLIKKFSK